MQQVSIDRGISCDCANVNFCLSVASTLLAYHYRRCVLHQPKQRCTVNLFVGCICVLANYPCHMKFVSAALGGWVAYMAKCVLPIVLHRTVSCVHGIVSSLQPWLRRNTMNGCSLHGLKIVKTLR
jgi:hypothetical protein